MLYRRHIPLSLEPLSPPPPAVQEDGQETGEAVSRPRFTLAGWKGNLNAGMYELRIARISGPEKLVHPLLYVDSGEGFSEREVVPLRFVATNAGFSAFFSLQRSATGLRFQPSKSDPPDSFEGISLKRIFAPARHARLLAGAIQRRSASPADTARLIRAGLHRFRTGGWEAIRTAANRAAFEAEEPFGRGYMQWIRLYDTLTDEKLDRFRAEIETFARKPKISVVMPVYNTPEDLLVAAIESVRAQVYTNWELCIADDRSTEPQVKRTLERYAAEDDRIKVVYREENGHISRASNSAIELATGEWIALLDHDDLLRAHALYHVVRTINEQPQARLIYSDEDKLALDGERSGPYFKSDWNYDLFLSQNMFSHLGAYHAELVRDVGGFRAGLEGSQDYDLALRCIARVSPDQIVHIPRILYHWRMTAGSTAIGGQEKPYAMVAGERAINDFLESQGIDAKAELFGFGYHVRYALPDPAPKASIIIPTRDGLGFLKPCVESILAKTDYPDYEIIIVDNGSQERETLDWLARKSELPNLRVVRDERPFNYSALNNRGASEAAGDILVLLNNDTEVITPDWLSEMVSVCVQPGVGAVGARLWYSDDRLQHGGVLLGVGGPASHAHHGLGRLNQGSFSRAQLRQTMSAVTAACMATRKDLYEMVGGLDEEGLAIAYNDVDYCLKLRSKGYRTVWTPFAELYHYESATRGYEDSPDKLRRLKREEAVLRERWSDIIDNDPIYNPNLSRDNGLFELAFPPRVD